MESKETGEVWLRFAEIVWRNEPIQSGELVKISAKELNWKKSTTYTVLHRLCDKGLLKNDGGIVTSIVSREEYYLEKATQFVEETFGGSLPAFLAAFTSKKKLSDDEANEIQKLIDSYKSEG